MTWFSIWAWTYRMPVEAFSCSFSKCLRSKLVLLWNSSRVADTRVQSWFISQNIKWSSTVHSTNLLIFVCSEETILPLWPWYQYHDGLGMLFKKPDYFSFFISIILPSKLFVCVSIIFYVRLCPVSIIVFQSVLLLVISLFVEIMQKNLINYVWHLMPLRLGFGLVFFFQVPVISMLGFSYQ